MPSLCSPPSGLGMVTRLTAPGFMLTGCESLPYGWSMVKQIIPQLVNSYAVDAKASGGGFALRFLQPPTHDDTLATR